MSDRERGPWKGTTAPQRTAHLEGDHGIVLEAWERELELGKFFAMTNDAHREAHEEMDAQDAAPQGYHRHSDEGCA